MPQPFGRTAAIRRANTRQWVLKPQDLAVALKLVSLDGERIPYAALAKQMRLSPFGVHAAVQRLIAARLATEQTGTIRPIMAAKFLRENTHKRSLDRDVRTIAAVDPFIGELPLQQVHHETLQPYIRWRLEHRRSPGTINRELSVVRRILNLSARLWRDRGVRASL